MEYKTCMHACMHERPKQAKATSSQSTRCVRSTVVLLWHSMSNRATHHSPPPLSPQMDEAHDLQRRECERN